jgi:DNA-directed RNA polymerase subunit RPC12/RpoP
MSKLKELVHILRQHTTVTFTLHGLGESIFECSYFDKAVAELDQLEAKAQELNRREKGCRVVYSHYEVLAYGTKDFYTCSECKQDVVIDGSDYCPSCGYRIDWKGESDNE